MNHTVHNIGIRPALLDEIALHAAKNGIEKVVLFGSRARGDYRRESDIDIAVYGGNPDQFRLALEEETSTLLCFDVVNMNHPVQSSLAAAIQKEGKLLYEKV